MSLLERIKYKPYEYRVRLVWIILGCCLVFLLLLWLATSMIDTPKPPNNADIIDKINGDVKESREYWEDIMPKKPENLNK